MAAQGEANYRNRAEMQRRGVAIAKTEVKYKGRARSHDYAAIRAWRAESGASIRETAEHAGVGKATVKRAGAEHLPSWPVGNHENQCARQSMRIQPVGNSL